MLALALIILLWAAPSWAAISWDANSNSGAVANSQNPSYTHTRGAVCANPVAVIRVSWQDGTPGTLSSVTYGGNAATSRQNNYQVGGVGGSNVYIALFTYTNPGSGASAVQANFSEVVNSSIISTSTYCGVDQTTPVGTLASANGASSAVSVSVTSAANELVVDVVGVETGTDTTLTVDASQTSRANVNSANNHRHGGSEEAGAASVTMSWALGGVRYWGILGIPIKPAADTMTAQTLMLLGVGN